MDHVHGLNNYPPPIRINPVIHSSGERFGGTPSSASRQTGKIEENLQGMLTKNGEDVVNHDVITQEEKQNLGKPYGRRPH